MSDYTVRRAFITLVREVNAFLERGIESDLSLFGLTYETLNDIENLPMILELAKDVISKVRAHYGPTWDDFGWNYWKYADIIEAQIKNLEPIVKKMIENKPLDLLEILHNIKPVKILPDGIDYNKYSDIIDDLNLPNQMFQLIFVCENILRKFIIKILNNNGISSISSLGFTGLTNRINSRKNNESKRTYLPIRGDHDVYYLDLGELKKVIINGWDFFRGKSITQSFISDKIDSLHAIRNRVAHNSGALTEDELKSVETYCREIIKQIDPSI